MTKSFLLAAALSFAVPCVSSGPAARAEEKVPAAAAPAPVYPALRTLFADLESSFRRRDRALFEKHIYEKAWRKNFAGGSGTSLKKLFRQGARKKWFLKPDLDRVERVGDKSLIVPCEVYSWTKDRSLQRVFVMLGKHEGRWVLVGGGKKHEQVLALAERFDKDEALAPPAAREQKKAEEAQPAPPPATAPAPAP